MENLFKAFINFQKEFKGMKADATNPFFKSTYITLDGILETVRPILTKNGLAIFQEVKGSEGTISVKTKILHESGESLDTEWLEMKPAKSNDPQALGSCITYAKRYQLGAVLGICESIDDDGNKATGNKSQNKLTESQIKRLYAIALQKSIAANQLVDMVMKKYKKRVENLSKEEYDHICSSLEK